MALTERLLLTCEHGGNRVRARYQDRFESRAARRALEGHRGWDPGALDVARLMALDLGVSLYKSAVTRLLVDLNRSIHHPALFSEFMLTLPDEAKDEVLVRYYWPHRSRVELAIDHRSTMGHEPVHVAVPGVSSGHRGCGRCEAIAPRNSITAGLSS